MFICIGIIFIVIAIVLTKLTVVIDCTVNGINPSIQVKLSFFFGLIQKKINLLSQVNQEKEIIEEIPNDFNLNKFIKNIYQLHNKVKSRFKYIDVKVFKWNTSVGTGEADSTGLVSGILLGLKGMLIGILNTYFTFSDKTVMNVFPVYQGKGFYTELKIIFSFRIIRLLIMIMLIYLDWRSIQKEYVNV